MTNKFLDIFNHNVILYVPVFLFNTYLLLGLQHLLKRTDHVTDPYPNYSEQ